MTDYQVWLIDEQIKSYQRMIAMHRKKILELTRLKNKKDYVMIDLGIRILNNERR